MGRTQIKTGDIANGAILNEDIAANADIQTSKIVGLAATTAGQLDGTLTVGPSGYLDASNASAVIRLPQGTTLPASGYDGQLFWKTDVNRLYINDGASWNTVASAYTQGALSLSDHNISTQSTSYSSITWFQADLSQIFPNNFYMQVINYQDTAVTGYYRLYDVTNNLLVQELVVFGNVIETKSEGTAITPTVGSVLYKFEHKKAGGGGTTKTYLSGAILRA